MSLRKRAQAMFRVGIDGDTHATRDQVAYDERGYVVIRFPAGQVEKQLKGALKAIGRGCEARISGGTKTRRLSEEE